jgi:hypothetical protein
MQMTRVQRFAGLGIVLVAALGLGYATWRISAPSRMTVCELSGRPVHPNMRTVAFIGKSRKVLCCPTCALSAGAQTHQPVRFEQLADYETARAIRPEGAFAVKGSDVIPCDLPHNAMRTEMLNPDGQPVPVVFDRCSPSIIVFAHRASAERFASQHGGQVGTFLEFATVSALRN